MIIWNVVKLFYDAHVCLTNTNSRIWGKHVAGQACTEWQRDDWVSVTRYGVQPSFKLCVILGLVQPYTGSWLLVSRFYIYIYIYYCMCWYIYIYLLLISSQGLMSINFSRFWLGWKLSSPISDGTPAKLQAPVEEQLKVKVDGDDVDNVSVSKPGLSGILVWSAVVESEIRNSNSSDSPSSSLPSAISMYDSSSSSSSALAKSSSSEKTAGAELKSQQVKEKLSSQSSWSRD